MLSSKMKSLGQSQSSLTNGLTGRGGYLDTQKTPCDDKGRDWSDAAVRQGTPGADSMVTGYEEAGKVSPGLSDPAGTWLSDFWSLEM